MLAEVSKGPVQAGGTTDYEQHLAIPPTPPSHLANCGIIDLEYNFKVEACIEGWLVLRFAANSLISLLQLTFTLVQ